MIPKKKGQEGRDELKAHKFNWFASADVDSLERYALQCGKEVRISLDDLLALILRAKAAEKAAADEKATAEAAEPEKVSK